MNSMAAVNQETTAELQALAMKDPRFRKGQTRSKGGGALPSGAKRRVKLHPLNIMGIDSLCSQVSMHFPLRQ